MIVSRPLFRLLAVTLIMLSASAYAEAKPNILVIWGDDIGQSNISAYTMGLVGYRTPNIDRIAHEGMIFTDYYGEQSCTAGRSSYITGQSVYRTGLSKVGPPRSIVGMHEKDPTIAGLLKAQGYTTAQFGQNRLGDKDQHLPTNHGFDEFFGNLYRLNAEQEPEHEERARDAEAGERVDLRGVIRSWSDGEIVDTGPLSSERMEAIDEETLAAAIEFIERANAAGTPFYVWWNGTGMQFQTHVNDEYAGGMLEHDIHVGQLLDTLDRLGIAENTIVHYSTDSGPSLSNWPDAGATPFFGEKNTNWEGGRRVPSMVRWPGKIKPHSISNEIMHHMDWLPTYLAAAGDPDIKARLKKGGVRAIDRRYKAYLDGYNFLPYLLGETDEGPRGEVLYFAETGELTALRYDDWKMVFLQQDAPANPEAEAELLAQLHTPLIFNLRRDPYERSFQRSFQGSSSYDDPAGDREHTVSLARTYVEEFAATFSKFKPRQQAAGFSIDHVMEKLRATATSN